MPVYPSSPRPPTAPSCKTYPRGILKKPQSVPSRLRRAVKVLSPSSFARLAKPSAPQRSPPSPRPPRASGSSHARALPLPVAGLGDWTRDEITRIDAQRRAIDDEYQRALRDAPYALVNDAYGSALRADITDRLSIRQRLSRLAEQEKAIRDYSARAHDRGVLATFSVGVSGFPVYQNNVNAARKLTSAKPEAVQPVTVQTIPRLARLHPSLHDRVSPVLVVPSPQLNSVRLDQIWYPGIAAYYDDYWQHFRPRGQDPSRAPYKLLSASLRPSSAAYPSWVCVLYDNAEESHRVDVDDARAGFVRAKLGLRDASALEMQHLETLNAIHARNERRFFHDLRDEYAARRAGNKGKEDVLGNLIRLLSDISHDHAARSRRAPL